MLKFFPSTEPDGPDEYDVWAENSPSLKKKVFASDSSLLRKKRKPGNKSNLKHNYKYYNFKQDFFYYVLNSN